MKYNRLCKTCGKPYYYCPTCDSDLKPSWFTMWDSERCKDIFLLLSNEFGGNITTEETKNQLKELNVNIKDLSEFVEPIQKHIDRVVNEKTITDNKKDTNYTIKENKVSKVSEDKIGE